jgi:hypothetical protein
MYERRDYQGMPLRRHISNDDIADLKRFRVNTDGFVVHAKPEFLSGSRCQRSDEIQIALNAKDFALHRS